jgi:site-specific recombinase XerD
MCAEAGAVTLPGAAVPPVAKRVRALRRTFSTHQVASGLPPPQFKEMLGHRKLETTYKYVHLVKTGLRENMEKGAL